MSTNNKTSNIAVGMLTGKKCVKIKKNSNIIGEGASGKVYNTTCSNEKMGNNCNLTTDECHNGVIKVIGTKKYPSTNNKITKLKDHTFPVHQL